MDNSPAECKSPLPSSREKRNRSPAWMKSLWREARSVALIVGVIVVLRSSVFGHYVIPSGSMQPSLKINDHVVANKLAYGLMLPFMGEMVAQWAHPKRGDVVIFASKESDVTLIKRVIGLGGDTISFQDGVLAVNGVAVREEPVSDRSLLADLGEPSEDKDLILEIPADAPPRHIMRQKSGGLTAQERRDFIVPLGQLFLMGDNRDGSHDSRFWGTVEEIRIFGKASFVAYSTSHNTPGFFRNGRFLLPIP